MQEDPLAGYTSSWRDEDDDPLAGYTPGWKGGTSFGTRVRRFMEPMTQLGVAGVHGLGRLAETALRPTAWLTEKAGAPESAGRLRGFADTIKEKRYALSEATRPETAYGKMAQIAAPFAVEGALYAGGGGLIRAGAGRAISRLAPGAARALGVGKKLKGAKGLALEAGKDVAAFAPIDIASTIPGPEESTAGVLEAFSTPEYRQEMLESESKVLRFLGRKVLDEEAHEHLASIAASPVKRAAFEASVGFGMDSAIRLLGAGGRAGARQARRVSDQRFINDQTLEKAGHHVEAIADMDRALATDLPFGEGQRRIGSGQYEAPQPRTPDYVAFAKDQARRSREVAGGAIPTDPIEPRTPAVRAALDETRLLGPGQYDVPAVLEPDYAAFARQEGSRLRGLRDPVGPERQLPERVAAFHMGSGERPLTEAVQARKIGGPGELIDEMSARRVGMPEDLREGLNLLREERIDQTRIRANRSVEPTAVLAEEGIGPKVYQPDTELEDLARAADARERGLRGFEEAPTEATTDLFGAERRVGPEQTSFAPAGPKGISDTTDDARTTISRLEGKVQRGAATPEDLNAYQEALSVVRRDEAISAEEVSLKREVENRGFTDEDTGDLFDEVFGRPEEPQKYHETYDKLSDDELRARYTKLADSALENYPHPNDLRPGYDKGASREMNRAMGKDRFGALGRMETHFTRLSTIEKLAEQRGIDLSADIGRLTDQFGKAHPAALRGVVGAGVGASLDEENRLRGGLIGFGAGTAPEIIGRLRGMDNIGSVPKKLETKTWEGVVGDKNHLTRTDRGTVRTELLKDIPGEKGEVRGEHTTRTDERYQKLLEDIRENGIKNPIFVVVEPWGDARIYEGNNRLDAAMELGLKEVPVEIRAFGKGENASPLHDAIDAKTWAGRRSTPTGLPMDEASRMARAQGQGFTTEAYHGTTRDIDRFTEEFSNPESHYGRGHYFSSEAGDVNANYATDQGPDISQRIELETERMTDGGPGADDPILEYWQEKDVEVDDVFDLTDAQVEEASRAVAKEWLGIEHKGAVIPARLRLKRPAVVGGAGETVFSRHAPLGQKSEMARLFEATDEALQEWEVYGREDVLQELYEASYDDLTATEFDRLIRENVEDLYDEASYGGASPGAVVADVFRKMGFDGIDMDANAAFNMRRGFGNVRLPGMVGVNEGTRHYIVFDPSNIRSRFAKFDPENVGKADLLGQAHPEAVKLMARTGAGAAVGAAVDEENRLRGGLLGGGVAAGAPAMGRGLKGLGQVGAFGGGSKFYSRLERAVEGAPFEKGTAEQWKGYLNKAPGGISKGEREWTGIDRILGEVPGAKIQKADLLAELDQSGIKLDETVYVSDIPAEYAGKTTAELLAHSDRVTRIAQQWQRNGDPHQADFHFRQAEELMSMAERNEGFGGPVKFEQYTQPGGENYREILVQLEEPLVPYKSVTRKVLERAERRVDELHRLPETERPPDWQDQWDEAVADARQHRQRVEEYEGQLVPDRTRRFTGSHWDEPNVLTHLRTSDRKWTNPTTGKQEKVLFIEEIQSDWAQKGRKEGFKGGEASEAKQAELRAKADEALRNHPSSIERNRLLDEHGGMDAILQRVATGDESVVPVRARIQALAEEGLQATEAVRLEASNAGPNPLAVPDMPYKGTDEWVGLSLRRAIAEAVEGGYDRIAWASGEQAADLYDLRKQVSRIEYNPETQKLIARNKTMRRGRGAPVIEETVPPERLADYIGKEPATRLMAQVDGGTDAVGVARSRLRDIVEKKKTLAREADEWGDSTPELKALEEQRLEAMQEVYRADQEGVGLFAIEGEDLAVGGEGMLEFYDKIVPKNLQKSVKPLGGGKIEPIGMGRSFGSIGESYRVVDDVGTGGGQFDSRMAAEQQVEFLQAQRRMRGEAAEGLRIEPVESEFMEDPTNLSLEITPAMRDAVKNQGQRLGGAPHGTLRGLVGMGAGASIGAAVGSSADTEDPRRGALRGGLAGLAVTAGGIGLSAARGARPTTKFAGDATVGKIASYMKGAEEFSGRVMRALSKPNIARMELTRKILPLEKFGELNPDSPTFVRNALAEHRGVIATVTQMVEDELVPVLRDAYETGIDDVRALAGAQRELEVRAKYVDKDGNPIRHMGVEDAELTATVSKLSTDPMIQTTVKRLRAYYEKLLQAKLDVGLISQEQFNNIRAKGEFYIPFIDASLDKGVGGTGGGLYNERTGVRRLGSKEKETLGAMVDPFEQAALDTMSTLEAVGKQKVANAMTVAFANGDRAMVEPFMREVKAWPVMDKADNFVDWGYEKGVDRNRTIQVIQQGKPQHFEIKDNDLFHAWAGMDKESQHLAVKTLNAARKIFQGSVTGHPAFLVVNGVRDFFMSMAQYPMHGGLRGVGGAGAVGAGIGALSDEENRLWGAAKGASMAMSVYASPHFAKHIARTMVAMTDILGPEIVGGLVGGVGGAVTAEEDQSAFLRFLQGTAVGAGAGAGARLMGFKGNRENYKQFLREGGGQFGYYSRSPEDARKLVGRAAKGGLSPEDILKPATAWEALQAVSRAVETAPRLAKWKALKKQGVEAGERVFQARDLSLDFSVHGKSMRDPSRMVPFLNPAWQGVDKLVRLARDKNTWAVAAGTILAPSVLLWAKIHEDPELADRYQEQPLYARNTYWHIPKKWFGKGDGFWKVPKPFEIGAFASSLPERILDYRYHHDPEILGSAMKDLSKQYGPTSLFGLPIGADALVEVQGEHGWDRWRGRPVNPVTYKDIPAEKQYTDYTSTPALMAGRALKMSPAKIDHVLRSLTGSIGSEVLGLITDRARRMGLDPRGEPTTEPKPVFQRLHTKATTQTEQERSFWRKWEKAEAANNALKDAEKADDVDEYRRLQERYQDDLEVHELFSTKWNDQPSLRDQMGDLSAIRRELWQAPELKPEQREQAIGRLNREIAAMLREYFNEMNR